MSSRALPLGLTLALALCAPPARATPENNEGYGSRETALAGAVSADVPNGSALFYNPAGLVDAQSSQLSLGYAALGYALASNGGHGIPERHGFDASVLGRGQLLALPVAFGLSLGLSNGHLARGASLSAGEPRWVLYDSQAELVSLAAGLAAKPLPWLSVGAGVGFLAAMDGHFEVTGTALVSDGMGSEYDSRLRHGVNADLLAVRYPICGVTLRVHPSLALALSYRGEASLNERISGTLAGVVDAQVVQVPIRYDFSTESVIAFQPRELTLGASLQLDATTFNLDLGWQQWSRYPSPVTRSSSRVQAELPPGFSLNLPPDTALPPQESAHFHDRLTPRLGVEQRLALARRLTLALRGGYAHEVSPLSTPQSAHLVDSARHLLGLGVALTWQRPWSLATLELATHALWAHHAERKLQSLASSGPFAFTAQGDLLGAGLTLTLGFR